MPANSARFSPRVWMVFVLLLAFLLRLYAVNTEDHQSPDTYNYARQAELLRTRGLDGWRDEARRFVSDPAMLAVPPVTRTVFLTALAGWMTLTDTSGISSVAAFSCFLDIVVTGLLALFAFEVLGESAAAVAVLLYAVSPFALSIARHGWSDTLGAMFCLLNLLLALRCLRHSAEGWSQAAFATSLALTFGVKESPFAQACLVLVMTLGLLLYKQRRAEALRIAGLFVLAMLLVVAWTAFAVGGFVRVLQMYGSARDPHAVVPYLVEYQNGSVADWLRALWLTDTIICSFALVGLGFVALHLRHRDIPMPTGLLLCAGLCCVFPVLPMLGHQLYNVRYETSALVPACILAAFALSELWQRVAGKSARWRPIAVALLSACAIVSFWRYEVLVAQPDLQDLSLKMVLSGHN